MAFYFCIYFRFNKKANHDDLESLTRFFMLLFTLENTIIL
jgi:hypothetical protein